MKLITSQTIKLISNYITRQLIVIIQYTAIFNGCGFVFNDLSLNLRGPMTFGFKVGGFMHMLNMDDATELIGSHLWPSYYLNIKISSCKLNQVLVEEDYSNRSVKSYKTTTFSKGYGEYWSDVADTSPLKQRIRDIR